MEVILFKAKYMVKSKYMLSKIRYWLHCPASPERMESSLASPGKDPNSNPIANEYHFCTTVKSKNPTLARCKSGTI